MDTSKKIVATLVLITRDGKVLLGQRRRGKVGVATYNGPGGKLRKGETLKVCAMRETFEEIGVQLALEELEECAVITFYNGTSSIYEAHVFRADGVIADPIALDELEPGPLGWWHALDALPFEHMLISDREWMSRVLSGEKLRAEVRQSDDAKTLGDITYAPY